MKSRILQLTSLTPFITFLASVLVFAIFMVFTSIPFQADDYETLALVYSDPTFGITDAAVFARMPVSAMAVIILFKWGLWENYPKTLFVGCFAIHAAGFILLLRYFIQKYTNQFNRLAFFVVGLIFTLYPNNYEIHLWHGLATHTLGILSIALGYISKRMGIRIFLCALGLLTYDTFPFLLAGLCGLDLILERTFSKSTKDRFSIGKYAILFLGSSALALLTKTGLAILVGHLHNPGATTDFAQIWGRLQIVFKTMTFIRFHKTYWVPSLIELSVLCAVFYLSYRRRNLPLNTICVLIALPFVLAAPLSTMIYSAERAFYGQLFVKSLIVAFIFYGLFLNRKSKPPLYAMAALLAITYGNHWVKICRSKTYNFNAISKTTRSFKELANQCQSPCSLKVPIPDRGMNGEWILPPSFWEDYYDWNLLKFFPEKEIEIQVVKSGYDPIFDR